MRKKNLIVVVILSCLMTIGLILYFINDKEELLRGNIIVWTSTGTEYFDGIAQEFMKNNDRCKIQVMEVKRDEFYVKLDEAINSKNIPDIINIDGIEMNEMLLNLEDKGIEIKPQNNILNNYSSNFTKRRLQEVAVDNKEIGIPFTSNPLMLYIRADMLDDYGYTNSNFNTWEDVIKIGKDINDKSEGKVRILNYVGTDKEYIISLLIMQAMEGSRNEGEIKEEVIRNIEYLNENKVLNFDEEGEFLIRISSLEAMKEIQSLDKPCNWVANNVPSKTSGSNKFYSVEGHNLITIEKGSQNSSLQNKFLGFLVGNNNHSINHVRKGEFFISYLSTYNTLETERSVNNFTGKSPLVVMANVSQKAPTLKDYELYKKIKKSLIK